MTQKPFKGVIRAWYRDEEVICGDAAWHRDARPLASVFGPSDPVVNGLPMHTSRVIKLTEHGSFAILETRNSMYVLIEPRNDGIAYEEAAEAESGKEGE